MAVPYWAAVVLAIGTSRAASLSAQSLAAPLPGSTLSGIAAQPPFSTNSPRLQLLSALSATSWGGASAAALKRSAHTAAASSLRELSAASWAMDRAVPPVVHPPQVKPTTMVATAHPAHDQNSTVLVGRLASQRCPRLCLAFMIRLRGPSPRATWCRGGEPVASRNDPLACRPAAGARAASSPSRNPSRRAYRSVGVCRRRARAVLLVAPSCGRLIE